jgi:PHB/PHA accumulation regulator DNA-binding domain
LETPLKEPDRARRVIKRYSNRKLYDTQDSRYVTLLQIAEMVRGGEEVQIIDNNTKDDLTEVTLAQIIYEEQKAHSRNVPQGNHPPKDREGPLRPARGPDRTADPRRPRRPIS